MSFVVKNTTSWTLVDLLCPHTCRGCGLLGTVLCGCCKNNILKKQIDICPLCKRELDEREEQCCKDCGMGFDGIFVGGWREGLLSEMVAEYKYKAVRALGDVLVEVIDKAIPQKWGESSEVVIVPLPTIGKHVRQRGMDHTMCLAKKLARRRNWAVERLLVRCTDTVQVGTKAIERKEQAERAYGFEGEIRDESKYLLLDDVWTTGASAMAALKVLKRAGAKKVGMVVIEAGK